MERNAKISNLGSMWGQIKGQNEFNAIHFRFKKTIHGQIRGQIRSKLFVLGLRDQYEVKQGVKKGRRYTF